MIDDNTQPLIIVTNENRKIVKPLLDTLLYNAMVSMRQLQKYAVSLHTYEFDQLNQAGVVCNICGVNYLDSKRYYKSDTGIYFENNDICLW